MSLFAEVSPPVNPKIKIYELECLLGQLSMRMVFTKSEAGRAQLLRSMTRTERELADVRAIEAKRMGGLL